MIRASRWVLVLLIGIVAVQGCSSSKKNKADTSPDAFTFTDVADAALGVAVESNTVTVAGIDQAAGVSVSGASGATYAINGGAFVAAAGSVNAGDRVVVKVTSSAEFSDPVNVTLNIGGVSDVFTVTTLAADTTPEAFTFAAQTAVEFDSWGESEAITVSGINTDTPISVTGGEYKIGDGAFTSDAGLVADGDSVVVRVKASIKAETEQVATLTIGGESADLSVTSGPDTVVPEVAILFPPPYTMTEGDTVFVRGKARDVNGSLASISVGVTPAVLGDVDEEGFTAWSATVPLIELENTLTVTAVDVADNSNGSESVRVRMDPDSGAFPDNVNPTVAVGYSGDFGVLDGEEVYFVPDTLGKQIISIDLTTGKRSIISDNLMQTDSLITEPLSVVSGGDGKIYFSDALAIFEVNLAAKIRQIILSEGEDSYLDYPTGLVVVEQDGNKVLHISDRKKVYSIDLIDYKTSLITDGDPSTGDLQLGDFFDRNLWSVNFLKSSEVIYALTSTNIFEVNPSSGLRRAMTEGFDSSVGLADLYSVSDSVVWLMDSGVNPAIRSLNIDSGEIASISTGDTPNSINSFDAPYGIDCKDDVDYCLVVDPGLNAILAIDKSTGHRLIFSKSVTAQ